MHPGVWEKLVDALFWLQLAWIFSGFALMAYLALKVFPSEKKEPSLSSDSSLPNTKRPQLVTLGNYRFEMAIDIPATPANVLEMYPNRHKRDAGLR